MADTKEDIADAVVQRMRSSKANLSWGHDWLSAATSLTAGWFRLINSVVAANSEWLGEPDRLPSNVVPQRGVVGPKGGGLVQANFTLPSSPILIPQWQTVRVFWTDLTSFGPGPSIPKSEIIAIDNNDGKQVGPGFEFIDLSGLRPGQLALAVDSASKALEGFRGTFNGTLIAMVNKGNGWAQHDKASYQVTIGLRESPN